MVSGCDVPFICSERNAEVLDDDAHLAAQKLPVAPAVEKVSPWDSMPGTIQGQDAKKIRARLRMESAMFPMFSPVFMLMF